MGSRPRIHWATAHDGYRFAVRIWDAAQAADNERGIAPTRLPRARVFFLHGIISHGGWYESTCEAISQAGFEVHFLDRRGSGLNKAARGDVPSFQTWIRDVTDYVESASTDQRPAILAGISWGGKLALAAAKDRPHLLGGLALICPGLYSKFSGGLFQRLALGVARRTPARNWRVRIPLQQPRLFTDDPAWQTHIQHDELVLRKITVRAAWSNLELSHHVEGAERSLEIPTLLMLAGADRIIDNAATRRFFDRIAHRSKRLVEYDQAAHTFEFSAARERYVADFIGWCESIAQGA